MLVTLLPITTSHMGRIVTRIPTAVLFVFLSNNIIAVLTTTRTIVLTRNQECLFYTGNYAEDQYYCSAVCDPSPCEEGEVCSLTVPSCSAGSICGKGFACSAETVPADMDSDTDDGAEAQVRKRDENLSFENGNGASHSIHRHARTSFSYPKSACLPPRNVGSKASKIRNPFPVNAYAPDSIS